jgi:hypothetical protein
LPGSNRGVIAEPAAVGLRNRGAVGASQVMSGRHEQMISFYNAADRVGSLRSTPNGREASEDGDLTKHVRRAQNWLLSCSSEQRRIWP